MWDRVPHRGRGAQNRKLSVGFPNAGILPIPLQLLPDPPPETPLHLDSSPFPPGSPPRSCPGPGSHRLVGSRREGGLLGFLAPQPWPPQPLATAPTSTKPPVSSESFNLRKLHTSSHQVSFLGLGDQGGARSRVLRKGLPGLGQDCPFRADWLPGRDRLRPLASPGSVLNWGLFSRLPNTMKQAHGRGE